MMKIELMKAWIGSVPTPRLGELWVAFSDRGLVAVEFGVARKAFEASVRKQSGTHPEAANGDAKAAIEEALCEVAEYLEGKRRRFTFPIDWTVLRSDFQRTALQIVAAIPYGETRTYGQIASQMGCPQAQRAMGRANATNPMPLVIPCHRVIGSDGKLHGYGGWGGLKTKQWLLDLEKGV